MAKKELLQVKVSLLEDDISIKFPEKDGKTLLWSGKITRLVRGITVPEELLVSSEVDPIKLYMENIYEMNPMEYAIYLRDKSLRDLILKRHSILLSDCEVSWEPPKETDELRKPQRASFKADITVTTQRDSKDQVYYDIGFYENWPK